MPRAVKNHSVCNVWLDQPLDSQPGESYLSWFLNPVWLIFVMPDSLDFRLDLITNKYNFLRSHSNILVYKWFSSVITISLKYLNFQSACLQLKFLPGYLYFEVFLPLKTLYNKINLFFFWPFHVASGILLTPSDIKTMPHESGVQNFNHCTTREVPCEYFKCFSNHFSFMAHTMILPVIFMMYFFISPFLFSQSMKIPIWTAPYPSHTVRWKP